MFFLFRICSSWATHIELHSNILALACLACLACLGLLRALQLSQNPQACRRSGPPGAVQLARGLASLARGFVF